MASKSISKLTIQLGIPLFILLGVVILLIVKGGMEAKEIASRYIEDTAQLYMTQYDTELKKFNYDVINIVTKQSKDYRNVKAFTPGESIYYPMLSTLVEQNHTLKIRYKVFEQVYVYLEQADVMILEGGTVFPSSHIDGVYAALRDALRVQDSAATLYSEWAIIQDEEEYYLYSRYSKNNMTMGGVLPVTNLLKQLHIDSWGYEGIPYMIKEDGEILISSSDAEATYRINLEELSREKRYQINQYTSYSFDVSGITTANRSINILIVPSDSILTQILRLEVFLIICMVIMGIGLLSAVKFYYQKILKPMRQFVVNLKKLEEEQWIHQKGSNNILELEMANEEFKQLLKKIRQLKIAIYEKELDNQKTALEAMQMQIKPHFYLNCLSLIHGMADVTQDERIVNITEMLSKHMCYVMDDAFELKPLKEEIRFIQNYVAIQQIRYGDESFKFEIIMDDTLEDCFIPPLIIHNFIENAMKHA